MCGGEQANAIPFLGRSVSMLLFRRLRLLFALACALAIIGLTAISGMSRGMHHKISFGPESEQIAISVALSELVYELNLGYLGFKSVYDKLIEVWNRGAKSSGDPILIANSSDRDLMNEAIGAAASLGPQEIGTLAEGQLKTTFYDDMGQVDFDKLAFHIFGLKIESLYYLYFSLLAVSSIIFILTFRECGAAILTLLFVLFAFYVEQYLNVFSAYVASYPGMRHGSTLGLVPMWFFIFLMSRKLSLASLLAAIVQVAIFMLAWRVRGSVTWMALFICAVMLAQMVWQCRNASIFDRRWPFVFLSKIKWPIAVLLLGAVASSVHRSETLHPIYFTVDVLPVISYCSAGCRGKPSRAGCAGWARG